MCERVLLTSKTSEAKKDYSVFHVWGLMKYGAFQAKPMVGAPGDAYEQEADRMAEHVMKMPETKAASGTFFEPHFGHDFSSVRVHGDANAAGAVNTGHNIVSGTIQRQYTACLETAAEEFRRAPVCTPPTRIAGAGQNSDAICGIFPGGSADCAVEEETGRITGGVKLKVRETNPCVRPCVELHEKIHERQLRKFCPELKACYEAADAGKRGQMDCWKLAFGGAKQECEAYQGSVVCLEKRLADAQECASPANFSYAQDVLEGEKCRLMLNCSQASPARKIRGKSLR